MALSPSERILRARLAAHALHSKVDSTKHTEPARKAALERFEKQVDPEGTLPEALDGYARSLEAEGLASSSIARRLSVMSGLFRYAYEEGYITRDPAAHVRRPRVGEDSPTLGLDLEEARRILDAAPLPIRVTMLWFVCCFSTG